MLAAPQILHFRICGAHFLQKIGQKTRCVASECSRDALDQMKAFLSPCDSNSCAAAVCTSVRMCVRRQEGFVVFDGVCDQVWKAEKQLPQFTLHLRPHSSCVSAEVCWLEENKEEQKCTSTGPSERKEVGVRGEGAGWNNTIKDCFISAIPADPRWRKIRNQENTKCSVLTVEHLAPVTPRASFSSCFRDLKVFASLLRIYGWMLIVKFAKSHLQVWWYHKPHQRNPLF